ncbi:MAG TPA: ClpX C4-type zinc finger protein [Candidatus Dormibacteraeota bacterium]|nr:ClpX C4-type zinc finger protein [Candidatus Dormibacteraeota bacterium]
MIFRRRGSNPRVIRHHPRCSFCGKERGEGGVQLVAGAGVYICSECVRLASEILRRHRHPAPAGM